MFFLHQTKAILLLLLSIYTFTISTKTEPTLHECLDSSTETTSASYITNLNSILNTLSTKSAEKNTFYKETSNGIYALFNCLGDITNDVCQKCVENASATIIERCPSSKTAVIWYDDCILRYSNTSFFGSPYGSLPVVIRNTGSNNSPGKQETGELALMNGLLEKAPYSPTLFVMDKRAISGDKSKFRYGLVLCTRDLNSTSCKTCLDMLRDKTWEKYIEGYIGWRVLAPSCYMRYENYSFFNEPVVAPAPAPPTPAAAQPPPVVEVTGGGNNTAMIVGITVSSIAVFAAVLGFCFYRFRKKRRPEATERQEFLDGDLEDPNHAYFMEAGINGSNQDHTGEMQYFRLTTIMAATNNFSDSNKLGEGGFGPVYKGKLVDGKEIAVKRLSLKSGQGLEEFKNEVMFIVKLQHKNLVRLLGCCVERNEKLLVYEYLPNTSLDVFLFDQEKCKQLDWDKRSNIVSGIAKGIQYLHEDSRLKIIHRDLKASNVLLDDEMNPKISDFGTARMFAANQIEANTNRPVGTYGYMAPEYAMEGLFSMKSDIYSFGILLLEIVSGKKNSGFNQTDHAHRQSLLSYVWQLWDEGKGQELIDQNIIDTCSKSEALRWIHIALLCVQEDPNDRPSISSIILMLGSKMSDLPRPSAPPFSVGRFLMSDLSSTTTSGPGTGFLESDQSTTSASLYI